MDLSEFRTFLKAAEDLQAAVDRALPAYNVGISEELANFEERIDVAGMELAALRAFYDNALAGSEQPDDLIREIQTLRSRG